MKRSLPADPTGEILALRRPARGRGAALCADGVWFSSDERRAFLVVETRAEGFDIDAQQQALAQIGQTLPAPGKRYAARGAGAPAGERAWRLRGRTRDEIERDASRFSLLAAVMVAGLLLFAYRSARCCMLGLLPVMSGALGGIAAVSLGFGFVHGITLGFGVTLIGEAVDYAIYLFTQTLPGSSPAATLPRIWPTLRLGVSTSVCGFGAMLFSSFVGLAQLGLFSTVGLVVAVCGDPLDLATAAAREFCRPVRRLGGRDDGGGPSCASIAVAAAVGGRGGRAISGLAARRAVER